jgi:hypothetical protein
MSFTLNYQPANFRIDESLKDEFEKIQNYIPIYRRFFKLDEQSWNKISLNYEKSVVLMNEMVNYNTYTSTMSDGTTKDCFIKFCPLFDPIKIMVGKMNDESIQIPSFSDEKDIHFNDPNNSAYVDSFFTYLTSKLLHKHGFKHGLDCYGSYLAIKNNFRVDIQDDLEYLFDSEYFLEHKDEFNIDEQIYEIFQPTQSCKYKRKLEIVDRESRISDTNIDLGVEELQPDIISPIKIPDSTFDFADCYKDNSDLVYIKEGEPTSPHNTNSNESSSCSSRTSNTTNEDDEYEDDDEDEDQESNSEFDDDDEDEDEDEDHDEDKPVYVNIPRFPVNLVFLESCKETLDDYMLYKTKTSDIITKSEWSAILMQIVMTLIVYQEKFYCIHNDLHNANVMYVETDKPFLYYKYNDKHYKVPTFGKIWKIIDFGRAIYKFKGNVIFSDSFSPSGDASSQYNCEPYFDANKKVVAPNFNFDLCRLACSLYDYLEEEEELEPIFDLINDWLKDYKGRNVLYKKNGDERYPEFKLYKMISRTVTNNLPKNQLERPIFSQYCVSKKNIKKKQLIMNIDEIPEYF